MAELFIPHSASIKSTLPMLGNGLWLDRLPSIEALTWRIDHIGPRHLDILVDLRNFLSERLAIAMQLCAEREIEPWLYVICPDTSPHAALTALSECLKQMSMAPCGMLITPAAYLKSYQPHGPWPVTTSPSQALAIARELWPSIKLGGGMPTYFTELNRCRPDPSRIDFITHATSPIVHASDDMSVIESLESLPSIFLSCRALAPEAPYRVTTSAIGAWTNPYGDNLTPNDGTQRVTLSDRDPRQRGLFAAAWNVGYIAQAATNGLTALTLSSLGPPFDVADAHGWHPVSHVLRGLAKGSQQPLLLASLSEDGLAAVAWTHQDASSAELWLANCSDEPMNVALFNVRSCRMAMLAEPDVPSGRLSPDLLDGMSSMATPNVQLSRFAVARLAIERASS